MKFPYKEQFWNIQQSAITMAIRADHAQQTIETLNKRLKSMEQEIQNQQYQYGNMTEYNEATYANVRDLDVSWLVLCGMSPIMHACRVVLAMSSLSCQPRILV